MWFFGLELNLENIANWPFKLVLAAAGPFLALEQSPPGPPQGPPGRGGRHRCPRYGPEAASWPPWRPLTGGSRQGPPPRARQRPPDRPHMAGLVRGTSYYSGSYKSALIPYYKPKMRKTLATTGPRCSANGLFVFSKRLCTTFSRPFSARACTNGPQTRPSSPPPPS